MNETQIGNQYLRFDWWCNFRCVKPQTAEGAFPPLLSRNLTRTLFASKWLTTEGTFIQNQVQKGEIKISFFEFRHRILLMWKAKFNVFGYHESENKMKYISRLISSYGFNKRQKLNLKNSFSLWRIENQAFFHLRSVHINDETWQWFSRVKASSHSNETRQWFSLVASGRFSFFK